MSPKNTIDVSVAEEAGREEPQQSEWNLRSIQALAGTALAYFSTVGYMNSFGVFQAYFSEELLSDKTDLQISFIGSFTTFMFFLGAIPSGLLSDKLGPKIPIAMGTVLQLLAIFMISLSSQYYQLFLAQGVLLGFGVSFVVIPSSTVIPKWFTRNRSLATGISLGGSSIGGVVWPIILDQLFNVRQLSFGWSIRIAGFVMIATLLSVLALVRNPEAKSRFEHEKQSDQPRERKDLTALKKPPFLFICSGLALAYFGFFGPYFYIAPYALSLGFSANLAFYLVSMMNGASFFGRIIPGYIADRYIGKFNVLALSCLLGGVLVFCWTAATSVAGVVIWALAYGFTSGSIMSLQLACATSLGPTASYGAFLGVAMASVSLTGLFGPPINGELLGEGFLALSCFSAAMLVAGGLLVCCSRLALDRRFLKAI